MKAPSPAPDFYAFCVTLLWHLVSCGVLCRAFSCNIYMLFGFRRAHTNEMHLSWESDFCLKSVPVTVRALNLFLGRNWNLFSGSKIQLNWIGMEKKRILNELQKSRRQFWAMHFFLKWFFLKRVPQCACLFLLVVTSKVLFLQMLRPEIVIPLNRLLFWYYWVSSFFLESGTS